MKRIILILSLLALSACGGLAPKGPDSRPPAQPQQPAPQQPQQPQQQAPPIAKKKYGWGLPIGDVSPNYNERDVYNHLRDKDCAGAQVSLDGDQGWQRFASPRNVLLAQAAIWFCKDDFTAGKRMFDRAKAMGWAGLMLDDQKPHASCEFYKSASSLIEQRSRDDFRCPKGEAPKWKQEFEPDRADPR